MCLSCLAGWFGRWRHRGFGFLGAGCKALLVFLISGMLFDAPPVAQAAEGEVVFRADGFTSDGAAGLGWTPWSQRPATAPEFFVAELPSLGEKGSLGISGASKVLAHGCWSISVPGITAGDYYSFEAFFLARGVPYPRQQVLARLDWRGKSGERIALPEYVPEADSFSGQWRRTAGVFRAPEGVSAVRIDLFLSNAPQGTVWWDSIALSRVARPIRRIVRVGTVNCRPGGNATSAESVEEFCPVVEEAGRQRCDIVCLGEGINLIGVTGNMGYADVAEPIPGPSTESLGRLARKWGMYIVACLGEREREAIYNTAVLIDRQGRIAGKYRKVQVPREEIESGITPGSSFPVFDTDFGCLGMMICWDSWYVEPARALAAQGAEIIFLPIWGGNQTLTRARAIENHVYVVSCGYDIESNIYDPWGTLIAEAGNRPGVAVAEIDLSEPVPCPYPWPLGNMRHRWLRERRADIRVPALER